MSVSILEPVQPIQIRTGQAGAIDLVIGVGPPGTAGPAGESFNLLASVADEASLPSVGNADGDARMTEDSGHIWQWHADPGEWIDGGQWQGPAGTGNVDSVNGDGGPDVVLDAADVGAQPVNAALTSISGLSPSNDDIIQRKAGSWVNRTMAQLKTDLAIVVANISDFASSVASAITTERTAAATLTNKTLTSPVINSPTGITAADVSAVPTTRTVNGHALSANVTVTADDVLPTQTGHSGEFLTTNGTTASWAAGGGGSGDVVGPASAVDSNLAGFDTATGKLLKDSGLAAAAVATLTSAQALTNKDLSSGTNTFPTFNQNTTGSAAKWTTGRTVAITGDLAYTSPSLDGTGNVTAAGTLATVNSNVGSFGSTSSVSTFTVNAKGLITAAGSTSIALGGSQVTSGTVDPARLGSGASITTKFLRGDSTWQTISVSGDMTAAVYDPTNVAADVFDAGNLGSGTVPTARLGSGTADNNYYLRGDSTWQLFGDAVAALDGTLTGVGGGPFAFYIDSDSNWAISQLPVGGLSATGTADSTTYLRGDGTWSTPTGGSGDVVGPASSVDSRLALFDSTTGKLLKQSSLAESAVVSLTGSQTLTNKTLTAPVIATISNTGTLTLPTSTDTLVGRATTDTLTNKTLTSPTLTTPVLGTPSSGTLTNCTGLPQSGVTNLTTDLAAKLAGFKEALVADVALSGNGTENIILQATLPANSLAAESVIKVTMYVSGLGGVTALTPRMRIGTAGTTADLQVGNSANTTVTPILNHAVKVEFLYTQRVAGGAGTATANCNCMMLAGNSTAAAGQQVPLPTATAATLSTTVQNICSVTLAQATATASVTECVIEVLP